VIAPTRPSRPSRADRRPGAVAGLLPAAVIGIWFALSGSAAAPVEVATSLSLVALIGVTAGWLAAPLADPDRPRVLVGAVGYALALIVTNATLAMIQAGWDASAAGNDATSVAAAVVQRAVYAIPSASYLLVPALITGLIWSLLARTLGRFVNGPRGDDGGSDRGGGNAAPTLAPARDPRRLGLGAAGIIAGYSLVVAGISAGLIGDLVSREPEPYAVVPRPILLGVVLMLPAAIAFIGAVRRSRPILAAAGTLCFAQSFIAFSGVTMPFVVPAILLIALAGEGPGTGGTSSGRVVIGGALVVVLGVATWIGPFALTETRCWVSRIGPDGTVVYTDAPVSDSVTLTPDDVGGGCDGGALTVQGIGLAAVFGVGAVATATLASMPSVRLRPMSGAAV
jgi:hypothetical protein